MVITVGTGLGVGAAVGTAVAPGVGPTMTYVVLTTRSLVVPVAVTSNWPGDTLGGTRKFQMTTPFVSAVSLSTVAPLKASVTLSPARKPVPVTMTAAPAIACGGSKLSAPPLWLTLNDDEAVLPLLRPAASTPYWPGAELVGTVKLRLKLPPLLTVGVPTLWPLKLTSTVSPFWNPLPLAVTEVPGGPELL